MKKCLPLYSQDHDTQFGWGGWVSQDVKNPTYEDYKYNGQYCKTGLAFPEHKYADEYTAKCTTTDHIKFDGRTIAAPYQCDPTNNEIKCELYFNITKFTPGQEGTSEQNYFNTTCKCAMDGNPNKGFCGSVLGTQAYQDALYALKPVLEKSNCHTLDRFDFRAHRDTCGIGFSESWKDAVSTRY